MKHSLKVGLLAFLFIFSNAALCGTGISPEQKRTVEEYFQHSIGAGLEAGDIKVKESKIDGLVEIYVQGKLMYFDIESQLLFIGEIYNSNGISLTKASLKEEQIEKLKSLPNVAVVLNKGKGGKSITEFTDPDCPYCRRANEFFAEEGTAVERNIYFDTRIHPSAKYKVIHILCAENQEQAFHDVYSNQITEYTNCDKGAELADMHQKASIEMAVSGTPTFFIGDNLVRGFDRQKLADYLRQH